MKRINKKEQGQVLVLLTLGMITLLGFTALAIDAGRLYSEKRTAQGVADTSSLTGALYIAHYEGAITSGVIDTAIAAAESRAGSNGYVTDVNVAVRQESPYYIVTTTIHSAIPPTIAQLVYNGPLAVTVESEARVYRVEEFAFGNALYSMSTDQKNALEFTGNATISVTGTGIYSNSGHADNSISFGGSSTSVLSHAVLAAGGINVDANVEYPDGTPFTSTDFETTPNPLGMFTVPPVDCSYVAPGTRTVSGGDIIFSPGRYSNISENTHANYIFEKGFYCIDNGFTTKNGVFTGDEVSFYIASGAVDLAGEVDIRAPRDHTVKDGEGEDWNGMLLHLGTGTLTINGNSESYYEGTIYAPAVANPTCKLNGSSDTDGFNVQLVCDSINVNGDGTLNIFFDNTVSYIPPVEIDLWE